MKRLTLPTFALTALFAGTVVAATAPTDPKRTTNTQNEIQTQDAQESANGSMTETNLTGNVAEDTSELTTGTTSGMSSGAIIDHTSKKKKKKKKKPTTTTEESESGASSQSN